jgi:hypothetical protein
MVLNIQRYINITIIGMLAFLILFSSYVVWLAVWDNRQPPVEYKIESYTKEVPYGNDLVIVSTTNRLRACTVVSVRHFKDLKTNVIFDIPLGQKTITQTGVFKISVDIDLPPNMTPDPYLLQFQWDYYCNPLNYLFGPITYLPEPIYFQITDPVVSH